MRRILRVAMDGVDDVRLKPTDNGRLSDCV